MLKNQKFTLNGSVANKIVDENGTVYDSIRDLAKKLGVVRGTVSYNLKKNGVYEHNGVKYYMMSPKPISETDKQTVVFQPREDEDEYQEFKRAKSEIKNIRDLTFDTYDFSFTKKDNVGDRYAIALFSDAHIEETVKPESVLGKNEYNVEIAERRIKNYFQNLGECLKVDDVNYLIFASLGDTISGMIHDELSQCNGLSPLKAIAKAQSLIVSGLKYLCENTNLKTIKFIGIVGNHSRTTKKIQHANGFEMSYEWLMYQNIKSQCESLGLQIDFAIPESEVALVNAPDGRMLLFCHGFQIKSSGSNAICGIYPALNRLSLKWTKIFHQDRIYLGHFHSCTSIPNAAVNGSIIGYNSFALTNGFEYQEPCQYYEVIDSKLGQLLERKIYCK